VSETISPLHDPAGLSPADARRNALYLTLHQVPEGKVVSYGQLAELAGLGRAARYVGRTLSQFWALAGVSACLWEPSQAMNSARVCGPKALPSGTIG
jgi:hypothetical protein